MQTKQTNQVEAHTVTSISLVTLSDTARCEIDLLIARTAGTQAAIDRLLASIRNSDNSSHMGSQPRRRPAIVSIVKSVAAYHDREERFLGNRAKLARFLKRNRRTWREGVRNAQLMGR